MELKTYYNASPLGVVAVSVIALAVTYVMSLIIYRLNLHPLAKFPGPVLAKITDFYSVYHAWKGDRHIDFLLCHEKYGPIFRYGPNRLSFNSIEALHAIHSAKANVRKGDFYYQITSPNGHTIGTVMDKNDHSRKRRVMAHAFSEQALKSYEEAMISHIRIFCEKLRRSTEAVNIGDWCEYLTADILGALCFGTSFGMLEQEENRFVTKNMVETSKLALMTGGLISPSLIVVIQKAFFSPLLTGRVKYRIFAQAQAAARTSLPASQGKQDFFHYLIEAKNPHTEEKWSLEELWGEANMLIIAGTDTSATTLAATFFYLTHNARCLEKVKKEVRDAFKEMDVESVKSGPELSGCRYLRACLDEAMRMNPPIPGVLPRAVLPGGFEIGGHFIPEGFEVGVCTYAIHHNAEYFPEPFLYRPERWLEEGKDLEVAQKAFSPFSLGPRGCVGKNMAYMEMMITMARVLKTLDMKVVGTLGEGKPDGEVGRQRTGEFQVKDHFICCKAGPMIKFEGAV